MRIDGQVAVPAPVELIRDGTEGRPLFLFHPGGFGCESYRPLVDRLVPEVAVYGCGRLMESETIPQRAAHYLEWITRIQPAGRYRLAGWSFGGFLAWETAAQAHRLGLLVDFVMAVDAVHPRRSGPAATAERLAWLRALTERDTGRRPLGDARSGYTDALTLESYLPSRYEGPFVLFRCTDSDPAVPLIQYDTDDPSLGWAAFRTTPVRPIPLPGSHWSVMREPAVTALARTVNALVVEEI